MRNIVSMIKKVQGIPMYSKDGSLTNLGFAYGCLL